MGRTVGDSYEHLKESVDAFSYQILVIKTYACLPEIKEGAVPWEDGETELYYSKVTWHTYSL